MLLEALIARGRSASVPSGYEQTAVTWVLRITADGQFVGLTSHETPKSLFVPKTKRTSGIKAGTGIDNFIYTVGAGDDLNGSIERCAAFREVLTTIDHPAATAVLTFLQSPTRPLILPLGSDLTDDQFTVLMQAEPVPGARKPLVSRGALVEAQIPAWRSIVSNAEANHPDVSKASEVVRCAATPETRFEIEVEGHPNWLVSPEVAAVHRARLDGSNAVVKKKSSLDGWMCSLCYQRLPLARLFPESSRLGVLCSFNEAAWNGYGLSQGYNAPTCVECAENIALGLDNIAADKGLTHRLSKEGYLLWWPKNPSDPAPWPLLKAAMDPAATEAEREAALVQITDGHFASVEKFMKRLALRRYVTIEAETLRKNVRRWNKHCTPALKSEKDAEPVWLMAMAVTPNTHKDSPKIEQSIEVLYLSLIGDELPPPRALAPVQLAMKLTGHDFNFVNRRRAAFLAFAGESFGIEEEHMSDAPQADTEPLAVEARYTGTLLAMFNAGRLFARLDLLQRIKSKPQRSLEFTHTRDMLKAPETTINAIYRKYGTSRSRNGKEYTDPQVVTFMQRIDDAGLPSKPDMEEQNAFLHGFRAQKTLQQARYRAKKNAETTNPVAAK